MWAAISGMASLKITPIGSTSTTSPCRVQGEALRRVHPRVGGDHRDAAEDAGDDDGNTGPEVRPRLETAPAEDVDGDEDRLGEEEQAFEGERDAERLAPLPHEARPQQPELERQDRPGDGTDGERDRHVAGPALGQLQRRGITVLDAAVVGDEGHERPRHAERHQDDVARQRERHLGARPRHRVDGQDRLQEPVQHGADHRSPPSACRAPTPVSRGAVATQAPGPSSVVTPPG